ncbi:MAG: arylsulfatase [Chlorobi bacterium]|nr:arylsulfatase [Chlorobiota bacterium]
MFSVLTVSCSKAGKETKYVKPNIIYILADDLGYAELGAYGQKKIETPNIDRLANNGMKFTQHYAGAPVCAPSRCVLLTGKHLGHSLVRGNDEWTSRGKVWDYKAVAKDSTLEGQFPIPAGTITSARLLQKAGYETAIIGKWGLGAPQTDGVPNKQGFDYFFGYNCQRQAHTYYPLHLWENDHRIHLNNDTVPPGTKLDKGADPYDINSYTKYHQTDYAPELMFNAITKFVDEHRDRPFFLYWATPIPHAPLQAPQRWVDYYVKKFGDEEPYTGNKGYFPCRYPHATYAAMISYLDENVGKLVMQLKDLGIYDNTIIIFTSDNGPTYNGGTDSPWFDSAHPFRSGYGRGKGFVYEGGIRVPMIAEWPGKIKPGTETDHISAFYDVLPTLCDIAGIDKPEDIDGISFLPVLEAKRQKEHGYLYWEFPEYGGQLAVRMGKWKAVCRNVRRRNNFTFELYDLQKDISESKDVSAEYPEIIEKIKEIVKKEHVQSQNPHWKFRVLGDK